MITDDSKNKPGSTSVDENGEVWTVVDPSVSRRSYMKQMLEAERTPRAAASPAELKQQLLSLISVRYTADPLAPVAVRLNELNRRFGVTAHRLGTTTRDLLIEMIDEGTVQATKHRDSVLVLPHDEHEMQVSALSPFERSAFERDVLERAFPSKGSTATGRSTEKPKARFPWE